MPLPPATPQRTLKHRRTLDVQVFSRGDGLWEVDATLEDVKTCDSKPGGELRRAGEPIHAMRLRLVVDSAFDIHAAGSETHWMPYTGHCNRFADSPRGDAYGRLAGLNLMRDFRAGLRERVGGALGCTHLTELAQVLPTAVVQAFAGEVLDTRGEGDEKPFQLDRCHALKSDGEVVRTHYPRWYRPVASGTSPTPEPSTI